MKKLALSVLLATSSTVALSSTDNTCFPKNDLHLEDNLFSLDANITEAKFNEIITNAESFYRPLMEAHGANFSVERKWNDGTVNAYASQSGNNWTVSMFGGLARRPETTPDGFALVVCHEIGHHLAGFPFYDEGWASSEGQSDYFASQSCAKTIWGADLETNATFRASTPEYARNKCDIAYADTDAQNLCYRTAMAGKSLASLLAALGRGPEPQFDTPNPTVATSTQTSHPEAQCRLDTYFYGGLCTAAFEETLIPGRRHGDGQASIGAERDAAMQSCTDAGFYSAGKRPRCWYAPKLALKINKDLATKEEIVGNGDDVWDPGETFGVNLPLVNNLLAPITGAKLTITEATAMNLATVDYPEIEVGESAMASAPVQIGTPRSRQCGDKFTLKAKVEVGTWSDETNLEFMMGGYQTIEEVVHSSKVNIPDNTSRGVTVPVVADTEETTKMVNTSINITHTYIGDLTLSLISPDGSEYKFFNQAGGDTDNINETFEVAVNDEMIRGEWKLKMVDGGSRDVGHLNSLTLDFSAIQCSTGVNLVKTSK